MNKTRNARPYMVVVGAFMLNGITAGVLLNALGTLIAVLAAKVNSDVATIGLYMTLLSTMGTITTFILPPMMKKMKLTTIISIGTICGIIGILMIAWAKSVAMIFVAAALCGVTATFCGNPLLMPVINRWFLYNRGTVASIMSAGEWLFTTIFSYIIAFYLGRGGYEPVCYIVVGFMVVIFTISTYVLVKGFPEDFGMKPLGYDRYMEEYKTNNEATDEMPGLTREQIFKKGAYWIFVIVTVLCCLAPSVYNGQRSTIFRLAGMTEMQVATLVSVYAAAKTIWRILSGFLADKISLMFSGIVTFIMAMAGAYCFMNASSYDILLAGAVLAGGALGFPSIFCALGTGLLVGQKSQSEVGTIAFGTTQIGVIFGPVIFKWVYSEGNMTPVLSLALILWVVFAVLFVICFAKKNLVENDGRRKILKKNT